MASKNQNPEKLLQGRGFRPWRKYWGNNFLIWQRRPVDTATDHGKRFFFRPPLMVMLRPFSIGLMRWLLGLWVGLSSWAVEAQNQAAGPEPQKKIKFDHLTVHHGLSQSSVLAMAQDRFGFIWMGTRDGLNRYDGYGFTVFRHQPTDSTTLAGNLVLDLAEDAAGNMWVATDQGLSYFDRARGVFVTVSREEVRCLAVDKRGVVWAGTAEGLQYFDAGQKAMLFYRSPETGSWAHAVSALYCDAEDNMWIGTNRHGIFKLGANRLMIEQPYDIWGPLGLSPIRIEAVLVDRQRDLWIGTYGHGLIRIIRESGKWEHYHTQARPIALPDSRIRALTLDQENQLWVGTFDGLAVLSPSRSTCRYHQYEDGVYDGLSHNSVRSLLTDAKGTVWIGTYFGGVSVFDRDNQRFEHYYHIPTDAQSLSYNVVGAFAESSAGSVLIGTERGGLTVFDPGAQAYRFFTDRGADAQALSGNTVKSIYVDHPSTAWLGIFRGGLNKLDLATGRVKHLPAEQPDFAHLKRAIVNTLVRQQGQSMGWVGTDDAGGLHKFNFGTEQFEDFPHRKALVAALRSAPVKSIWMDDSQSLWLATRGSGLVVFDERMGVVQHFDRSTGFPSDDLLHIFRSRDGHLWVATHGQGVVELDPRDGTFTLYTTRQGLQNDLVFGTLEDATGSLWFLTINGISRWQRESGHPRFFNFSRASGFPLEEINEGAFLRLADGRFLIGGSNGYVVFDPQQVSESSFIPPIVITDVRIYNERVKPGDGSGILERDVLVSEEIVLDWHHSVFTLEFAALSFLRSDQNHYQYRLTGFDDRWMDAGPRRSVTYTNLRDGTYVFEVKGASSEGVWSTAPARLVIRVLPPPWKTWWAFVGYALIILGGVFIIRHNAVRSAQLKHDLRVEQLEKERIESMHRLKLQYFTDVSHEFRTPLTLIVNPLEEMLKAGEASPWMQRQLHVMYDNCRRMRVLIDQVLEMRQVETGHAQLQLRPVQVAEVVERVVASFRGMADHQSIRLVCQVSPQPVWVQADINKLETIFFNLLSNAFKFTSAGGTITVQVKHRERAERVLYVCRVSDTGQGIEAEDLPRVFDRFFTRGKHAGSGIGLSLTRLLVQLMGGTIEVASKPQKGASFTVRIPFPRARTAEWPVTASVREMPRDYVPVIEAESVPEEANEPPLVLVVEDNPDLRAYLKTELSRKFRVLSARNGEKGLHKVRKHGPHLVVSDVMMDGMDGLALCRAIRQDVSISHIPVILLTAKGSDSDRLTGLEEGADAYLVKPFLMHELIVRIQNMLAHRQRIHAFIKKTNQITPRLLSVTSHDEKLMTRILEVIQKNIANPALSVEFLGAEIGMSRVHLFRKLKALTGQAPADFIRHIRLQQAAQLLRQPGLKIWEVAEQVGFQDVAYFGKCFKKVYGMSPSEYGYREEEQTAGNKP